jgi:hypothetical protein
MRFDASQPDDYTSPYWLLAIAALLVGTFLYLRD